MAAQRLPVPGQDDGTWGDILNGFLGVEHNSDGTLKIRSDGTVAPLSSGKVPASNLGSGTASATNYLRGDGTWSVPAGASNATTAAPGLVQLAGDLGGTATAPTVPGLAAKANTSSLSTVATSGSYTDLTNKPTIPTVSDATTSTKGIVQLAGDLAGTAIAPTVPGLASKEPTITAGTTSQYYRGDKTFQTLDKTAVGLANVDNTSDVNKPVSTATQTALNAKANTSSLATVATSGSYTDLTSKPTIPAAQVNSDWTASSGVTQILNKPILATVATSSSYNDLSNKPTIPTVSDATTSVKGIVQLAGDLAGTAAAPTVAKVNGISVTGTPSTNQVLTATSTTAASWATPASTYAITGAYGDGTHDDTAAIQSALTAAATTGVGIVRGAPGATYFISAALIISSGTTLDMTGCILNMSSSAAQGNMLLDSGHNALLQSQSWVAPSNITVKGGIWNRGSAAGANNGLHTMILGGDHLTVRDLTMSSSAGKYCLLIQNATNFTVEDIYINGSHSDGVHMQGPLATGVVRNVHGTSGDDLVAITGCDYTTYQWGNEGNVTDILIDGVFPINGGSRACIVIPGSNNGTDIIVDRVTIRNVSGSLGTSAASVPGIIIGNDTAAAGTQNGIINRVVVENVALTMAGTASTRQLIQILTQKAAGEIILRNLYISMDYQNIILIGNGTIASIVTKLLVDGVAGAGPTLPSQLIAFVNTSSAVSVTDVIINNIQLTNPSMGGSLIRTNTTGSQTLSRVQISNCIVRTFSWIADLATATTVACSGVQMISAGGTINIRATGAVTLTGMIDQTTNNTAVASGGTVRVKSIEIPVDLSAVNNKNAGDMAYNTNSSLACGVGPCAYNATSTHWVNLATAATY